MPNLSPTELDRQYNARAAIPEHPEILARWAETSGHVRRQGGCEPDYYYGATPDETLDFFPARRQHAPLLVFIHGGWWRALDKRDHSFVAPPFVERGAMVVVPNYALCPAVSIETITLQMVETLAWVHRHAARFNGDGRRIVVAGHSAGGHLSAMLLSCRWPSVAPDLPAGLVRSALSISGVFDLEPLRRTPFLQADLRLTPAAVRRLSPAGFPRPSGRLMALVGGNESEEFLRQNRLIRRAWGARAVPVCEALPGTNHLDVLDGLVDRRARLHTLLAGLLDAA